MGPMPPLTAPGQLRIGDALIAARARAGLDLKLIEERTKIREKYLRALEEEQWEELPSDSHAKGFLRTYAQLLGLDADQLVDEYRRQVEGRSERLAGPLSDRLLEGRPAGERRSPRAVLIAAGIAAAVVLTLVIVGLLTDEDSEPTPAEDPPPPGLRDERGGKAAGGPEKETVRMRLVVLSPVEVCLVGGEGNALIDAQVLAAGTREEYRGKRLELRFPSGYDREQLRLKLGDEAVALPALDGPAAFGITPPAHVREASAPGRSCP